jgi:hypothetical protein
LFLTNLFCSALLLGNGEEDLRKAIDKVKLFNLSDEEEEEEISLPLMIGSSGELVDEIDEISNEMAASNCDSCSCHQMEGEIIAVNTEIVTKKKEEIVAKIFDNSPAAEYYLSRNYKGLVPLLTTEEVEDTSIHKGLFGIASSYEVNNQIL